MKKLLIGMICVVLVYTSANAKEGNNSRIQDLEAQVAELQNQINTQNVATASTLGEAEVVFELCKLYLLTGNTLPILCGECGNSEKELIEQCDDGNNLEGDGCSPHCLIEECGNSIIDPYEECDDGNIYDGDGCSSSCAKENKIVFLTSKTYTGNLGGLEGADKICNDLAGEAGLPGTYKAWLSDSETSVSQRLPHDAGPYVLGDGTLIAENWNDLTDGYIDYPIDMDENISDGGTQKYVWTNTQKTGEKDSNTYNCENWTTSDAAQSGNIGVSSSKDYFWTDRNAYTGCSTSRKLYCFQL